MCVPQTSWGGFIQLTYQNSCETGLLGLFAVVWKKIELAEMIQKEEIQEIDDLFMVINF